MCPWRVASLDSEMIEIAWVQLWEVFEIERELRLGILIKQFELGITG